MSTAPAGRAGVDTDFQDLADAFVGAADRALADGDFSHIASEPLGAVLTAAMKLYTAKAEAESTLPAPIVAERLTPTEAVLVITEMLRACNLNLFDLALWYRRAR